MMRFGFSAGRYTLPVFLMLCGLLEPAAGAQTGIASRAPAVLHALGAGERTAKAVAGKTDSGSGSCLSMAAAEEALRAGRLGSNGQPRLCEPADRTAAARSSFERAGRSPAAPQAAIEPAASTAVAPNPTGGFSGFQLAPSYQATPAPYAYANTYVTLAADFLRTGNRDLLTIDSQSNIRFLANKGDGTFASPVSTDITVPGALFTAYVSGLLQDFDSDGYPDLIARELGSAQIVFLRNQHDGTFVRTKALPLPANTYSTAAMLLGDVTGDRTADLIVFRTLYSYVDFSTSLSIYVYPGTGSGDFASTPMRTDYVFPQNQILIPNRGALLGTNGGRPALYMEARSLNQLGINGSTVFALPLHGDGTFEQTPYTQQDFPSVDRFVNSYNGGLGLADLNQDGIPDITMSFMDGNIYTALGRSDGTFPVVAIANPHFSVTPQAWELRDMDGDGLLDFVVKDFYSIEVLPGLGTGKFGDAPAYYATLSSSSGLIQNTPGFNMVVDDFDGDRIADLVYVDGSVNAYNRAYMLHGYGDGTFFAAPTLPANNALGYDAGHLYTQALFDTNGDGFADIVTQDTYGLGPYPYRTALSDGKGGFSFIKAFDAKAGNTTFGYTLASADLNGDGRTDLVVDTYDTVGRLHGVSVALSNGDGTFHLPVPLDLNGTTLTTNLMTVAAGDVDGDGIPDLVAVTSGGSYDMAAVLTFTGKGDGTFQPAVAQPFGNSYAYAGIALADLNGDGKLDLLLSDDGLPGTVLPQSYIVFGKNAHTFDLSTATSLTTGLNLRGIRIGDLNGDGRPDLVLACGGIQSGTTLTAANRGIQVYLNNGNGTLTPGNLYETGIVPGKTLLTDINGDGKLDIVSTADYPQNLPAGDNPGAHLLLGGGDGTFGALANLALQGGISFLGSGDLDGDGTPDLVTWSFYVGTTAVVRNVSGNLLTLTADARSIVAGTGVNLTASVQPKIPHRPQPTGTVTFTSNGKTLGTAALQAGSATLSVTTLPVGTNIIQASYSGDLAYSANSKSGTVSVAVTTPPAISPDFSLAAPVTSLTLSQGSSGSVPFSLAANSTFSSGVTFSAAGLPDGMSVSFAPASAALTPNGTFSGVVFVSTTRNSNAASVSKAFQLGIPLFGSLCTLAMRRRRLRSLLAAMAVLASLAGAGALSGCASSPVQTVASGDYTLVVKATPTVAGASVKAFNLSVHVN